jgi:hypothetical protein
VCKHFNISTQSLSGEFQPLNMFFRLISKKVPLARAPIVLSLLGATVQQCAAGRVFSHWAAVPAAPPDKILGLSEAFKVDSQFSCFNVLTCILIIQ